MRVAKLKRETVMQEAVSGSGWVKESHIAAEHLDSIRDLNHRFLDLAELRCGQWSGLNGFEQQLAPLSGSQRAAAANCPYALFDLRFEDDGYWKARLRTPLRHQVADEPRPDDDTVGFVRLAIFYAWHVASTTGLAAQLLLGMHSETAQALRRTSVNALPGLAATEAANLTVRWSNCRAYWSALTSAALRADPPALRRVQLYGLQLAAASRLPLR
jgi:hypothetical protein